MAENVDGHISQKNGEKASLYPFFFSVFFSHEGYQKHLHSQHQKIGQPQSLYYRFTERKCCQGKIMMKGVNLVRTKEYVCKEKVVFSEIEDATLSYGGSR